MSNISSLSTYNTQRYTSALYNRLESASQASQETQQSTTDDSSSTASETRRHRQTAALDGSTMQALFQSMNGASSVGEIPSAEDMIASMDTDSDGSITQEEFVAARPDDVSEEMATNLWNSFDAESAGSLTTDELQTAMAAEGPHGPPPPPPSDEEDDEDETLLSSTDESDTLSDILSQLLDAASGTSSTEETSSFSDMVTAMDTDGDGIVTQEEFVAARPDDVSEEMATNLWNSFDAEGAGSLSTSDLQTAMAENAPPGGPQMANASTNAYQTLLDQLTSSSSSSSTDSTSSSSTTTQSAALQAFLEAVQAYESSAGYNATRDVLSSLMALA